jgi:sulfur carrier protein ThiS adenylyltransferase
MRPFLFLRTEKTESMPQIIIRYNESLLTLETPMPLSRFRAEQKPDADLMIVNGFPTGEDYELKDGDALVLIKRGEIPDAAQLESLMMARHTPGVHARITKSCVGIAGAGGLGSNIAICLARIGVGKLILADFDLVEPSNLNRQQYFIDQIGLPKVTALKQNLLRINPYVEVEIFQGRIDSQNLTQVFAGVDVMVEAFDAPDQKALLTRTHLQQTPNCPLVAASGMAGFAPGNDIRTHRIRDNFYLIGDLKTAAQAGQGLMAPRVSIAAGHQANAVLCLLLGEEPT